MPNAWAVAAASPWEKSTQPATAPKASTTGTTTSGWNSAAKGAVSRRVTAGSVTTRRNRSASNGSDRRSSGSLPSARRSRPSGRSVVVHELPDVLGPHEAARRRG